MFGLSAIECFAVILIIYAVLYWITPHKASWIPMLITVLLLSFLAFNVNPNDTDDLSRYFMQLDYLREYGREYLDHCFETSFYNWDTYRVCAYYFYFLSKFPDNHWMPAITIFICYGLMFLVMYKASRRFEVQKSYLFLGTMFFLCTYWFYDVYSGVRNGLTFAVIVACAYYHLVERKRILLCYIGYFLASLTHSSGIMIVAFVILTEITLNNSGRFMSFLLVFGLIGGGVLMQYLDSVIDNKYVHIIAGQAEKHQAGEVIELGTMFLVNITLFVLVSIIVMYYSHYLMNSNYSSNLKRFHKFSSIILYFMISCLFSGLIFVRIARWILPVIGALYIMIGMQFRSVSVQKNGSVYLQYYSPPNESIRFKLKTILDFIILLYTAVHGWYMFQGSSLHWLHF